MTWRMKGRECRVAGVDGVTVGERYPRYGPLGVALGPWQLEETSVRKPLRERGCAGGVIHVRVGHQHLRERAFAERPGDLLEMTGIASTGINQRRHPAVDQPGPVPVTGDRPGVARV